jgi:hypothetical protein
MRTICVALTGWVSELVPGLLKETFSGNSKRLNTEVYPGFGMISSIVLRHYRELSPKVGDGLIFQAAVAA